MCIVVYTVDSWRTVVAMCSYPKKSLSRTLGNPSDESGHVKAQRPPASTLGGFRLPPRLLRRGHKRAAKAVTSGIGKFDTCAQRVGCCCPVIHRFPVIWVNARFILGVCGGECGEEAPFPKSQNAVFCWPEMSLALRSRICAHEAPHCLRSATAKRCGSRLKEAKTEHQES